MAAKLSFHVDVAEEKWESQRCAHQIMTLVSCACIGDFSRALESLVVPQKPHS